MMPILKYTHGCLDPVGVFDIAFALTGNINSACPSLPEAVVSCYQEDAPSGSAALNIGCEGEKYRFTSLDTCRTVYVLSDLALLGRPGFFQFQ